jgi:hypothetical protein
MKSILSIIFLLSSSVNAATISEKDQYRILEEGSVIYCQWDLYLEDARRNLTEKLLEPSITLDAGDAKPIRVDSPYKSVSTPTIFTRATGSIAICVTITK